MKILYLADPNSIHDIKWISYFSQKYSFRCFLLPRRSHLQRFQNSSPGTNGLEQSGIELLAPIHDFSIARFHRTLSDAFAIRRIIKKEGIDIVHILYAEPNALWCWFKGFFAVSMIITTRGTDALKTIPDFFRGEGLLNRFIAAAYRRAFHLADRITATSTAQAVSIKQFSGREENITVIRTGVDAPLIAADTTRYFPLKDSRPYIFFPRYLKPQYNHELSLAAIALLPPEIKARYKMVFIGKDTTDVAYQRKINNLMMEQPDVQFELLHHQRQEAIFELYKRASVVVMNPLSDGAPVSAMEALLCGARLILGPLNYDEDIFASAIRMQTWDPAELASLIVQALNDQRKTELSPKEIAAMSRETNMEAMHQLYRSVTGVGGIAQESRN